MKCKKFKVYWSQSLLFSGSFLTLKHASEATHNPKKCLLKMSPWDLSFLIHRFFVSLLTQTKAVLAATYMRLAHIQTWVCLLQLFPLITKSRIFGPSMRWTNAWDLNSQTLWLLIIRLTTNNHTLIFRFRSKDSCFSQSKYWSSHLHSWPTLALMPHSWLTSASAPHISSYRPALLPTLKPSVPS